MSDTNRFEMEHGLIAKAIKDSAFRAFLQGDPKTAVEQYLGAPLPTGTAVKLLIEDPQHLYIVIPDASHAAAGSTGHPASLGTHTRKYLEGALVSRLPGDPQLMHDFLANPGAMIRTVVALPADVTVEVVHEDPSTLTILFPYHGHSSYHN
jgi:hypothetical protein